MKRVTLISLFFCLALTTILAQVVTTNIATPVAGLSTNSVADFDVNSDGTILNNSATSGTATLGSTAVTANSNITAGSEANLILLQVTGTAVLPSVAVPPLALLFKIVCNRPSWHQNQQPN